MDAGPEFTAAGMGRAAASEGGDRVAAVESSQSGSGGAPDGGTANVARVSLTDSAYAAIEELIVTLALRPGEVLSEGALSQRLDIGRTPVREALQRLAREHLVSVLPRRGILVSEFNVGSQLRMLEVRREIERLMARSAALRATPGERERFASLATELRESAGEPDGLRFMRLDSQLNQLVCMACRNEYAVQAISLMAGLSRRFWFMHHQRGVGDLELAAARHAELAEAIGARNAAGAADASDGLMDYIEGITREALDW